MNLDYREMLAKPRSAACLVECRSGCRVWSYDGRPSAGSANEDGVHGRYT